MKLMKVLMAPTMALALTGAAADAQTVLRFSDYGPNRGTRAEALEWFADELSRRTDGAVTLEFFWGGSLLGGADTLGGIASGVTDMGTVVGFFTPQELQLYTIGDLPFANSDIKAGMHAMYELSLTDDRLAAEFDNAGVRYVTNFSTGPVELICRNEVQSLDALNGLKIRASGPYADTLQRLGAEIVTMSQADVYQALDSGLIDCNQTYYYTIRAYRQDEVAKHVLELDWGQNLGFGMFINPQSLALLDAEQQQILAELSTEFLDYLAEGLETEIQEAKAAMVAGDDGEAVTIATLSPEDRARLNEVSREAVSDWLARAGADGPEVLAAYEALMEKHLANVQ